MESFLALITVVFLSVLCDNLLLTIVVPILPELLREKIASPSQSADILNSSNSHRALEHKLLRGDGTDNEKCTRELFHLQMLDEDSKLGLLLSTKALMQLLCNPIVGTLVIRMGCKLPLCIGNSILCLCSLAFGFADSYILFLIARTCHGLASSLIIISAMALVAEIFQKDSERTKILGRVLGAAALGVLIGYPFGGLSYAFVGRSTPFLVISALALLNTGYFASKLRLNNSSSFRDSCERLRLMGNEIGGTNVLEFQTGTCRSLLRDKSILVIFVAIWFSTTAMSVLEPTLPVWLIENIDPPEWQLGLVFVPDSLGYFLGTSFFGPFALRIGRWKTSLISMGGIGLACFLLPLAKSVWQLAVPHFILGLGLGIVDASLMPLLAWIADEKHHVGYGTVYALAQTSVALAYALGPLIGGQLVRLIGFPDLIRSVGFLNLLFSPFNLILTACEEAHRYEPIELTNSQKSISSGSMGEEEDEEHGKLFSFKFQLQKLNVQPNASQYKQLYCEFDSD